HSRTRHDVTAALALRAGARAAPSVPAGHLIQRIIQFAGDKGLADLNAFAALPPVGIPGIENVLLSGFCRWAARFLFQYLYLRAAAFFFSPDGSWSDEGTGSPASICAP